MESTSDNDNRDRVESIDAVIDAMIHKIRERPRVPIAVRLIYILWDLLLDGPGKTPTRDSGELYTILSDLARECERSFANNSKYLLFLGYMMSIAPYLFDSDYGRGVERAQSCILKARELDPESNLVNWGYFMAVGRDAEAARELAKEIKHDRDVWEDLRLYGKFGDYLREMISSSADEA